MDVSLKFVTETAPLRYPENETSPRRARTAYEKLQERGTEVVTSFPGIVKVKMLHRRGATILLPEVLVAGRSCDQWVQPRWVYAPNLHFFEDSIACVTIDFAALDPTRRNEKGIFGEISFSRRDRRAALCDNSEVYCCRITTESTPGEMAIGRARIRKDGGINLRVYHHTAPDTLPLIRASSHVRGSPWNYQGTRRLANVSYAYFTSLAQIITEQDLHDTAMASDEQLPLRLDTSLDGMPPDLVLKVKRGSTRDRQARLMLWVPAETISTPHIWQHIGPPVVYEIAHPWIYRVGLQPNANLDFADRQATPDPAVLKHFDYAVIGDCTRPAGLEAPFDEENTSETFSVQDLAGADLFDFWRTNANTLLYAPPVVTQEFAR